MLRLNNEKPLSAYQPFERIRLHLGDIQQYRRQGQAYQFLEARLVELFVSPMGDEHLAGMDSVCSSSHRLLHHHVSR